MRGTSARLIARRAVKTYPLRNTIRKIHSSPADRVSFTKNEVHISLPGPQTRQKLPNIWLRDNCRCTKCVNQDTAQRNFNTFEIPRDVSPSQLEHKEDGLRIVWKGDNHESFYPWEILRWYLLNNERPGEKLDFRFWAHGAGRSEGTSWPPEVGYEGIRASEEGLGKLLHHIRSYGLGFVTGVPHDNADHTEALLESIGPIRETHYGGFYDFIPDLAKADTAYTNIALAAHTDTTYFTEPAGLQAFHLLSHTGPENPDNGDFKASLGGQSLLVDGFTAALTLRREDPKAFEILTKVPIPWHASGNKGINIAPRKAFPVIELSPDTEQIFRIRWNNDDRGIVPFSPFGPTEWYDAARKWDSILRRKEMEYWFQLVPGRVVIFDNWRVLHGRSAFQGVRRICGGYINRDDFMSRWRNTNFGRDSILRHVVG